MTKLKNFKSIKNKIIINIVFIFYTFYIEFPILLMVVIVDLNFIKKYIDNEKMNMLFFTNN